MLPSASPPLWSLCTAAAPIIAAAAAAEARAATLREVEAVLSRWQREAEQIGWRACGRSHPWPGWAYLPEAEARRVAADVGWLERRTAPGPWERVEEGTER